MAIIMDITQQVADKQKIINAEERMRLAVDSAELGTYEVNLITGDVITSPFFNELFDMVDDKDHVDMFQNYIRKTGLPETRHIK